MRMCLCIGHTGLLVLFQHCDAERVSVTAAPCLQCLLLPRDNLLAFSQLSLPPTTQPPPCQQSYSPHTDGKFIACPYHAFNPLLSIGLVAREAKVSSGHAWAPVEWSSVYEGGKDKTSPLQSVCPDSGSSCSPGSHVERKGFGLNLGIPTSSSQDDSLPWVFLRPLFGLPGPEQVQ